MADELNIITTNQAGDGWVDQVPGPVSSGYQAQNTLMSSTLIGIDRSEVSSSTSSVVVIEPSGPIDVDGQPFIITSRVTLRPPIPWSTGGYYYIKVASGSTWDKKSLVAVAPTSPPIYDYARRGLYFVNSAGARERCLNWIVYYPSSNIDSSGRSRPIRILNPKQPGLRIENFLNIDGPTTNWNFQFTAGDIVISHTFSTMYGSADHSKRHELAIKKDLGEVGGTFKVRFGINPNRLVGYGYTLEEIPASWRNLSRIVKYTRPTSRNSTENFEGTYPFMAHSSIALYAYIHYRGGDTNSKNIFISSFDICASQELSPLMRRLLLMTNFRV